MKRYNPSEIEPKWQQAWADTKAYDVTEDSTRPKAYVASMFPYPSGAGLHVGHVRNYSIGDVIARFHRQRGYNVLQPIGWDTFGLPAENYAIKTGTPPAVSTLENIKNFKNQYQRLGMSIDWSRELNTTDPEYYKWTQWIFTKLFERGLAYQAERLQWWCPHDKTVLANEQVEAGKCWRCGNEVIKKSMNQWFFKITEYADELLDNIDDLDWPEGIKAMQRNWIGKSSGAEITFAIDGQDEKITVFTTRPDTLYGATFLVLAPEHERAAKLTTDQQREDVEKYIQDANKKSEVERQDTNREKTGVFTGSYAVNPVNNEKVPVWLADYVLTGYGTGAIMAVPAHDERDYAFAQKFNLGITEVVAPEYGETLEDEVWVDGVSVIVYDEKTDHYLGLDWDKGATTFVSGGLENDESYEQCARRELSEEAGITDIVELLPLGGPVFAHYHHDTKGINRVAKTQGFLAIVADRQGQETRREAHETFHSTWYTGDELTRRIAALNSSDHWIEEIRRARSVISQRKDGSPLEPMTIFGGEGILINSGPYDGVPTAEAREKIVVDIAQKGQGTAKTNYRMRDWLISRQRYWGAPIPIIHCDKDGAVAVPEADLPVVLPEVEDYQPDGTGTTALGRAADWVNTTCPKCGGPAKRETDTMDGYACSSWYYLRYTDAHNDHAAWDPAKADYWMPIDYYCGGDHAVSHLLYSRFWTKVFADMGLVNVREPVKKLVYNGYINAADGTKMSKSKGNVVDPLELVDAGYGADAVRVYELFIAPYDLDATWDPNGIAGSYRFLNRVWNLVQESLDSTETNQAPISAVHKTIKKVTDDLTRLSFNTAIAAQMELVNELYKAKSAGMKSEGWQFALTSLVQMAAPFAPHVAEELWQQLGNPGSVHVAAWPIWDDAYLIEDTVTIAVQINGKVRGEVKVAKDSDQVAVEAAAKHDENVVQHIAGKDIRRVIYVPNRLLNIVL